MKRSTVSIIVALVVVAAMGFTSLAEAQRISGEERDAIFASAPKIATSVPGASLFQAPPKGFNPLTATNRELLSYGLPQAPDKDADPMGYQHWERAMLALKTYATDAKAKPYSSVNARSTGAGATANVDGTSSISFYNWSGIANTNKDKSWNKKTSFDEVVSYWNEPVSNHPFGNLPCSEGPWFEVTWNGIDGFSNGDVVQGGSAIYWDDGGCGGPIEYFGWWEWYPSYSIIEAYCSGNPCFVSPGDDFVAVTYGAPGTSTQNVFIEDITQQWSGTLSMAYQSGPGLVGNSAEYIVERPCCSGSNEYPLANYIFEFMGYNYAYDVAGTLFYPGSTSAATYIITMVNDQDSENISFPLIYGSSGNAGRYSIMMEDENCAYSGGCTP